MKKTIQTGLVISALGLALMAAIAALAPQYSVSSEQIPIHLGLSGEPDRFTGLAGATRYLWIFPAVYLAVTALLVCVPAVEPLKDNLVQSRKTYLAVWFVITIAILCIQASLASSMIGFIADNSTGLKLIIVAVALTSLVMGNYLPKTRQSFFLGIRTPWTLTSETSWEKTHRLAGKIFLFNGLAGFGVAIFATGAPLGLFMPISMGATAVVLIVYSYFAWRNAGDKITAPDYLV